MWAQGNCREATGSDSERFAAEVALLALTREAGSQAKERRQLPSAGKVRRQVPLEPQQEGGPADLDRSPVSPIPAP